VGIVGGEQVVHAGLRVVRAPAEDGDGLKIGLPGGDHQRARVHIGLEYIPGAVEEVVGVVVVRRAAEHLHGVGLGGVGKVNALLDVGALDRADHGVVGRRVVVHGVGVGEQAVIGDDRDALVLGLREYGAQRRAVDG